MNATEEEMLRAQLEEATRANFTLKTHIEGLNDYISSHLDQVDVYRDQLLELSQSQSDVSEDAISKVFQSIFTGVELWIDELVSKPGFEDYFAHCFTERLADPRGEKELRSMINNAEIDWYRVGSSENCSYTILSLVIGDCLEQDVLRLTDMSRYGHIYPRELRSDQMRCLSEVQDRMGNQTSDSEFKCYPHSRQV